MHYMFFPQPLVCPPGHQQHSLQVYSDLVMSHRLDDAAALAALLQQWGAPAVVLTRLQATGFNTLGLLAHALPSPDAEDSFICTVLELDQSDATLLHTAPAASLRRLLVHAQELCPSPQQAPSGIPALTSAPSGRQSVAAVAVSLHRGRCHFMARLSPSTY